MKTFLWTSLFWILAAFVCVIGLGFCNFPLTPFIGNYWMVGIMPTNLESHIASKYNRENEIELDCNYEEACKDYVYVEEDVESSAVEEDKITENSEDISDLSAIIKNQHTIYSQMNENYENLLQALSQINCTSSVVSEEIILDEKSREKIELESQIEELQEKLSALNK